MDMLRILVALQTNAQQETFKQNLQQLRLNFETHLRRTGVHPSQGIELACAVREATCEDTAIRIALKNFPVEVDRKYVRGVITGAVGMLYPNVEVTISDKGEGHDLFEPDHHVHHGIHHPPGVLP